MHKSFGYLKGMVFMRVLLTKTAHTVSWYILQFYTSHEHQTYLYMVAKHHKLTLCTHTRSVITAGISA